jgi:NAD(P)-dependent dehydrogenase (short-subunit alcohol dehydrogenase family)
MKTIAIELAKDNIIVNAVEPGHVISGGLEELGKEHMNKIASVDTHGESCNNSSRSSICSTVLGLRRSKIYSRSIYCCGWRQAPF